MNWRLVGAMALLAAILLWLGNHLEQQTWSDAVEAEIGSLEGTVHEARETFMKEQAIAKEDPFYTVLGYHEEDVQRWTAREDSLEEAVKAVRHAVDANRRVRMIRSRVILFSSIGIGGAGLILIAFGGKRF